MDGRVVILPTSSEIPEKSTIVDCSGMYVTQAFINGHHLAYSALAHGRPRPKKNPTNFVENLKSIWWTLDQYLDPEMIRISALLTTMECAKIVVTFVSDHHASPGTITGSPEIIARAFDDAGIGYPLNYETSDRDGNKMVQHLGKKQILIYKTKQD